MDRPLGACIARISSPSKDCKEQYLCTYSLQLVASTAISETDGSLNHTLGRRGIKKGKMPVNQGSAQWKLKSLHCFAALLKRLHSSGWTAPQIPSAPQQTAANLPRRKVLQLLVGVGEPLVDSPVLLVLHVLEIALQNPEEIKPRCISSTPAALARKPEESPKCEGW